MTTAINRRLGRDLVTHLDVAKDLIGQAIEAVGEDHFQKSLELWRRARAACVESKHELAHTWFQSCELAIARLEQACRADPELVDLTPALRPDLGQSAVKARAQERAVEAQLEAAKREKIAEYNRRRHGDDIAVIEKVLEQLTKVRPNSGACAVVGRLRNDLLCGLQRGITPEQWKFFADTARREGITF